MRFLILAVTLAFTASPMLGQVRQEFQLRQRAEQGNASVALRLGPMYDLGWDIPQNDAQAGSWKRILIGAGIGLTLGFAIGWVKDEPHDELFFWAGDDLECRIPASGDLGLCANRGPLGSASLEVW